MVDPNDFPFCGGFYVVEKTIELVVTINGIGTGVRIEALHDLKNDRYCTHAYIEKSGFLEPTDPADEDTGPREPVRIWTAWTDFPWTSGQSADAVLHWALSFLRERCQPAAV